MSTGLEKLGKNIRTHRLRLGMTQTELAGGCDITRNMLSRIENGAALPSLPTFVAIAAKLDMPIGALIGEPLEYQNYLKTNEIQTLFAKKKYAQILELYSESEISHLDEQLSALVCKAHIERAAELYFKGQLKGALKLLDAADSIADISSTLSHTLTDRIFVLRLMIESCPALWESDSGAPVLSKHSERLYSAIFSKNEAAIYLYCRTVLSQIPNKPFSVAHPDISNVSSKIEALLDSMSSPLYRTHIEAKLDMARAEYLDAKAKLTRIHQEQIGNIPPSILYDLLADLELCCKCCGDFENAYKYSGARLDLLKRIN